MHKKKVLIVDNDKDFLSELREVLEMSGYELVAVEDPCYALEIASRAQVDVVLLDLKMPKKNGFDLAYELHHSPHLRGCPIIAMTGFYKEEYQSLFAKCGIRKCLKKPFRPLDVISVIEDALTEEMKNNFVADFSA